MAYNLSASGTPTYVTGKFSNALDSNNGYLQYSTTVFSATGTIEAWVKTTYTGTAVAIGSDNGLWIGVDGNHYAHAVVPGSNDLISNAVINDGLWHHLALTCSAGTAQLWVDGSLGASLSYNTSYGPAYNSSSSAMTIGKFASNGFTWLGQIDEVRFSNNARYTATFSPASTPFSPDSNTVALYHLDVDGSDAMGNTSSSRFVRNVDLTSLVIAATGFQTANIQTANYTLVRSDIGKIVETNVASANTVTIPMNSSVAFPVGSVIDIMQAGAGSTSIQAVNGVTLRAPLGTTLRSQYATVRLRQRAIDEWVLSGNLALTSTAGLKSSYPPGGVTSGLMLWLEAENLTGLYDGQSIASLTDGSGNYRHATQATAGYQPLYRTTAASVALPNNQPITFFDGSDDYMSAPLPVIPVPMSMVVVLRDPNPTSGYRPYIDLSAIGAGGTRFILANSNGPNFTLTGTSGTSTSKAVPVATYFLATVILAADGSATFYVNGAQVPVTGNPGTVGTHTSQPGYTMNRYSDGNPGGLGIVRAIDLVYNRALTSTERTQIESALISKYGIS